MLTMPTKDELSFSEDGNLSTTDIKRLFFVWFNSISNDYESIDKSQFCAIINRIFSTNTNSETKVSVIFDALLSEYGDCNKGCIYFHRFLSQNEDKFADIMVKLLQNDFTARSILQSVPNYSANNPSNDTLQQTLSDLTTEVLTLRRWIIETGLPSHAGKQTLQEDKVRIDMELKLTEHERNSLKSDQEVMSKSYSMLEDNYTFSVKQSTDLKSMNDDLQSSLDTISNDLSLERAQSNGQNERIQKLTKFIQEYKRTNSELRNKNEQQNKQITDLQCQHRQNQTQIESLKCELEQRTDEINKLHQELGVVGSRFSAIGNTSYRVRAGRESVSYDTNIFRFKRRASIASLMAETSHNLDNDLSANAIMDSDEEPRKDEVIGLREFVNALNFPNVSAVTNIDEDFETFGPKLKDIGHVNLDGLKRKHFSLMSELKKELEDISNTFKTDSYDCKQTLVKKRKTNTNVLGFNWFGFCLW